MCECDMIGVKRMRNMTIKMKRRRSKEYSMQGKKKERVDQTRPAADQRSTDHHHTKIYMPTQYTRVHIYMKMIMMYENG